MKKEGSNSDRFKLKSVVPFDALCGKKVAAFISQPSL